VRKSRQLIGNRFEIADPERDLLGRGGMGDVYRGVDLRTGHAVAIKALRPEVVAGDPNALARFLREGEALRQLDHPNIVKVVDGIEQDGRHYLVMEYVPGGSVRDLLDGGISRPGRSKPDLPGLSVERTVEIALDVADALTRAHRLGILHRDLKPSNVLLAEDGTPRLTDFGHAHLATGPRLTQTGTVLGTVLYLSPEACRGETLDARADIWAFGAMLYEMLTGEPPFSGETFPVVFMAILSEPVPDVQRAAALQARPDVPDALADLVYRMLEKDRAQRIPSVRLVGAELEAMSEGYGLPGYGLRVDGREPSSITESRFATSTPTTEAPKSNLPVQPTPFVGREAELEELDRLLSDPDVRLVTVLGVGGMGKTRLALEAAARQLDRYPDGVYFVSLAPLRTVEAIVPTVADALGVKFYGAESGTAVAPRQQLLDYLRQKNTLLLFDNYEHLLTDQTVGGVELVSDVLQVAPNVSILATSRASLNVQEEHLYRIGGMKFPDWETPEDVLDYSAVKLFMQSARRIRPNFALQADDLKYISRICRLVQGMPLGILLAAAWVEMLSPEEIARELVDQQGPSLDFLATDLRNVPERQRSMRAVFGYTWNLLTERERGVMEALSVFRGRFTRAAAQEVTGALLRALMALVNRSLLRRAATGRYEVHELLRQYAAEKLALSGTNGANMRDRHAVYYVAALERWGEELRGPRQLAAIEEIRADVDNARAAWDWAIEGDPERVLGRMQVERLDRALDGLCEFYEWNSHYEEGEAVCRKAADRLGEVAPHAADGIPSADVETPEAEAALAHGKTPADGVASSNRLRVLARALVWQGHFGSGLGRREAAIRCYERALAALDRAELSDPAYDVRRERAFVLREMSARVQFADLERARQLAERSLEYCRALGDRREMAGSLFALGRALRGQDDLVEAQRLFEKSLSLRRVLGDRQGMLGPLQWYSYTLANLGRIKEAERMAREAVAIAQQVGGPILVRWANYSLGFALRYAGRFAEARSLMEKSLASFREWGHRTAEAWGLWSLGLTAKHLGAYEKARVATEAALTRSQESGLRSQAANCAVELGRLALAEGAYGAAQEWLLQSIAIYHEARGMRWRASEAPAALAYVARGLGQSAQAWQHLGAALRTAAELHAYNAVLHSLPAVALLLMDGGEVERAVELYALASRHPFVANSRWFEDVAGKHITAAAATLPPDAAAAAQERGRARDLWATVEELLAELEA
jgi:predicted ATPase